MQGHRKAVILDAASLGEDIDLSPIRRVTGTLSIHDHTPPEQIRERLAGAEIAITNKVPLDAVTLTSLPALQLICVLATGTDNIDREAAERLGIAVRNIRGYGTASVAQHTMMLILALAGRLPLYQRDVAEGRWQQSRQFTLLEHSTLQLQGRHLVIVGQGELGTRVATLAAAFGIRVSFTARPGAGPEDRRPALLSTVPCYNRSGTTHCWSIAHGAASSTNWRPWKPCVPAGSVAWVSMCCRRSRPVMAIPCSQH